MNCEAKITIMTKRRLLRWSLLFVILGAFAVWLEPTRVVWGWLRGEAFYQGRPTSYWRNEIAQWSIVLASSKSRVHYVTQRRTVNTLLDGWIHIPEREFPGLLNGDHEGAAVLAELASDSSEVVRDWVKVGLERLEGQAKGAEVGAWKPGK